MKSWNVFLAVLIAAIFSICTWGQKQPPTPDTQPALVKDDATTVSKIDAASSSNPSVLSAGIINGQAVSLVMPSYPPAAKAVRAGGAVNVQVTIDEQGNVTSASAVSGHPLLRQAAEQAARLSKFTPTRLAGQAVKVTGIIVYNFVPANPQGVQQSNERPFWILGMFLIMVRDLEPATQASMFSDQEWSELAVGIPPELSAQRDLFVRLSKAKTEERAAVAEELRKSFKVSLRGTDAWQFAIGENLGSAIASIASYARNTSAAASDQSHIASLKSSVQALNSLLVSAPPEFSPELLKKLKTIGSFADVPDFKSSENLVKLFQSIDQLMNEIK